ncbi:STAS domain-containing protein [Kibdelosporangium persicum]|uniref:STAS domain-containing protein n=1 Tax=Kibdelosporangium persicum TaxID=2698649 RepID=UPI001566662F|nr:STAS domain-containing protein [Kibdelosporangium persicum]
MRFELDQRGGARVLSVHGEIDLATARDLTEEIDNVLREPAAQFVLDLRGVTFMSSLGISALIAAHNRVQAQAGTLTIVIGDRVRRIIQLTGLEQVLSTASTVDDAISTS